MTPTAETGPDEPVLKGLDAWWTVLVIDPLAVRLVAMVRDAQRLTATHLTVVAHLLGLVSAVTFALGWLAVSAVLFEVRFVLDCADGKLARVRGTSSAAGAFLDYVGDYLVVGANLVGLSLHLHWGSGAPPILVVGLPAAFLAHIAASQARLQEVAAAGGERYLTEERLPGGLRRWMSARRLRTLPSRIDVEHGLLFLAPLASVLFDDQRLLVAAGWLAGAYFAYEVVHLSRLGYRLAADRDAESRAARTMVDG